MKKTILLILILVCRSLQKENSYVDFVEDFVEYEGKQTTVTEFSCDIDGSVALLKKLTRNFHKFQCLNIDTISKLQYPAYANTQIFILNLDCYNSSNVLIQADAKELFKSPFRWILLFNSSLLPLEDTLMIFTNISILVDSDVNLIDLKENDEVRVRKVFKKHPISDITIEEMGFWEKSEKLKVFGSFEKVTVRRRRNLSGITLKACLVITHNDTFNHLTDKRYKHIDSITKVNYVLVEELGEMYNISLTYSMESSWGYVNDKNEWNGMIGQLIRKEADIGGSPLFVTSQRVRLIDYISMTTPTRSRFVFRSPKLSYVSNVYTLPFDTKVWVSTIFLSIIAALFLFVIIKWEWRKKTIVPIHDTTNSNELKDSVMDVTLLTFSAFCQQGASALPFSVPGRMASIFLYLSLMFLYTSYSANIVALLQSSSNSIKTLQDLLSSRLQIGVDDTVFNHFYFPNADDPVRRALYLQKVAPPGKKDSFMPIEEGVAKMRQGLFAFHMELGAGYKIVSETFREDEKCGLHEIAFLQVVDPWFAIQKNSTYKEMFKIGLRLIQESGIQARENSLIYTRKPICTAKSSTFITVGLVDCYPVATLLVAGILTAFGIFLLEIFVSSRLKFYKNKMNKTMKIIFDS